MKFGCFFSLLPTDWCIKSCDFYERQIFRRKNWGSQKWNNFWL